MTTKAIKKEQYNIGVFWETVFKICFTDKISRLSRWEYWNSFFALFFMPILIVEVVCSIFSSDVPMILIAPYFLFFAFFNLMATISRLHDTGHSGWNLLLGLIPLFGIVMEVVIFFWLIRRGDLEENSYGGSPKKYKKSPFYKRWWFWYIVIWSIFGAIVKIFGIKMATFGG